MKRKILIIAVATALGAGTALAAPPPGKGGGKPGGGGETTLGNNLSLPTKFVGGGGPTLRVPCPALQVAPTGPTSTYFEEAWWLQKTAAIWSAQCQIVSAGAGAEVGVTADWGDNLVGDARLAAGRPIRVEMALIENTPGVVSGMGYAVQKLTPDVEDRLATYGTQGDELNSSWRVFDNGARLAIHKCTDKTCAAIESTVYDGLISAEINSMGSVVYGFNWGTAGGLTAATPGTYRLTFTTINVPITGNVGGELCGPKCARVYVTVGTSGGGKPPGKGGGE